MDLWFPSHGHPSLSHLMCGQLQCALHGDALGDHLKAPAGPECSASSSSRNVLVHSWNTSATQAALIANGQFKLLVVTYKSLHVIGYVTHYLKDNCPPIVFDLSIRCDTMGSLHIVSINNEIWTGLGNMLFLLWHLSSRLEQHLPGRLNNWTLSYFK